MPPVLTPPKPGRGAGWERLAESLRPLLGNGTVDGIWVFRTMRAGPREFGTAILSQVEGDRRRIVKDSGTWLRDLVARREIAWDESLA